MFMGDSSRNDVSLEKLPNYLCILGPGPVNVFLFSVTFFMILHLLRDGRASMYVLCTTWIHSALRAEVRLMRRIRTKVHGIESETSDFQKRPKAQGLNFFHINRCLYIR